MSRQAVSRVRHVKAAITTIRDLLNGRDYEQAIGDRTVWLAFERSLEILSEASRHVPAEWKAQCGPDIPWRQVADLGNALRHVYQNIDTVALWSIYSDDLNPLEAAIDAMLAANEDTDA